MLIIIWYTAHSSSWYFGNDISIIWHAEFIIVYLRNLQLQMSEIIYIYEK